MTDHPLSVDVERIRELLEKATPAPWEALCLRKYIRVTRRSQGSRDETGNVQICHIAGPEEDAIRPWNGERWEANAALIVALRNAAPALLASAERLQEVEKENERLRAEFCRRGISIVGMTEWAGAHLCRAERAESALSAAQAERDGLKAEVERLNKWADGFSDAQLKERATAAAYQKELRVRLFAQRRVSGHDHSTSCSIWGDDGQGGTAEGYKQPLPCNCGALENFQASRAQSAQARIRELEERLRPFANWAADNTEADPCNPEFGIWAGNRCERERISVWFGPTDFFRTLLQPVEGEK